MGPKRILHGYLEIKLDCVKNMFNLIKGISNLHCLLLMTDFRFCGSLDHHFIFIYK